MIAVVVLQTVYVSRALLYIGRGTTIITGQKTMRELSTAKKDQKYLPKLCEFKCSLTCDRPYLPTVTEPNVVHKKNHGLSSVWVEAQQNILLLVF